MRVIFNFCCVAAVMALVTAEVAANRWEQWEWLNPRPQGHTLRAVAASEEVYVAVGDQGTILFSANGVDWETVRTKKGLTLQAVTWTGDLFVAAGGYYNGLHYGSDLGEIYTSLDGRHWTLRHAVGEMMLMDVHFNGEQILVVGYPGITLTSPDGETWIEHRNAEHPSREINRVAWDGSIYVGIGRAFIFFGEFAVFLSEDGINWTESSLEEVPNMEFSDVVWGHGRFAIFGGAWPEIKYVLTSPDGHTWAVIDNDLVTHVNKAVVTPDGYSVVTWYGVVSHSTDLSVWSYEQIFPGSKDLLGIVGPTGSTVVVGDEGAIAIHSMGAASWTLSSVWEIDLHGLDSIADISSNDVSAVAAATNGRVFRSSDGYSWDEAPTLPAGVFSVRWRKNAFWATGNFGLIAQSADGWSWDVRSSGDQGTDYSDLTGNDHVLVAVGARQDGSWRALAATSNDGVTWVPVEIVGGDGLRIASVTWSGSQFVAVCNQGPVFRSEDGLDWTIDEAEGVTHFSRIASNDDIMVAVGDYDDVWERVGVIATSDDGITWRITQTEDQLRDVIWTGDLFVVTGWGNIYTSTDGRRWNREAVGGAWTPTRTTVFGDDLIVAGHLGRIMRAQPAAHAHPDGLGMAVE